MKILKGERGSGKESKTVFLINFGDSLVDVEPFIN